MGSSGAGGGEGDGGAGSGQSSTDILVTVGAGGAGGGCDSFKKQGKRKPLHLYALIDKSSSMAGDKWADAKAGIGAFVESAASDGIDFALQLMPLPGVIPTCDAYEYVEPLVGWDALPGLGPSVVDALDASAPDGASTPVYPALGGALLATIQRVDETPGDAAAVLLVTDGEPQGPASQCSGVDPESFEAIADLAANALHRANPVYTFVVGLRGVELDFANAVAEAGGTDQAFAIVGDNPAAALSDALDTIRAKALPCSYELPSDLADPQSGVTIDEVNVEITVDGDENNIPRNDDCDGAGWYYDDPSVPTEILLCPDSCDDLRSDPVSELNIVLGCSTIIN